MNEEKIKEITRLRARVEMLENTLPGVQRHSGKMLMMTGGVFGDGDSLTDILLNYEKTTQDDRTNFVGVMPADPVIEHMEKWLTESKVMLTDLVPDDD